MPNPRDTVDQLAIALFSEMFMADHLVRSRIGKALPKGMELSHFSILHHLARCGGERTPADLARAFNVSRGAMTNTIGRLQQAGFIHVRPDWDDARKKLVAISPSGRKAWDMALASVAPVLAQAVSAIGEERLRGALPVMRELRQGLDETAKDEETS